MDDSDVLFTMGLLATVLTVVLGSLFGTYRIGRYLERRDLTKSLIESISATYDDGLQDGLKRGYKQGWKEAGANCDQEPLFSGRY